MGTWFSDKYAEGTIGHRFYAGCQNVDTVEALAAEHARELFGAPYAYAQPHSGIDANLVAFWSILAHRVESPALEKLGAKNVNDLTDEDWEALRHELGNQRMLGMSLDAGGHLTHGFRPNISGKMFHQRSYGTDPETGLLDYDRVARGGPGVQAAGADRRLLGLPAPGELRQDARDRRRGRRHADGRHGALRRPGRRQGVHRRRGPGARTRTSPPPRRTSRCAARAAAWCWPPRSTPTSVDRGCPMVLGGPLVARDGRQGGRARRGPAARRSRPTPRTSPTTPSRWPTGFLTRGAKLVTGGTDNHIVLLDVSSFGLTGRQAESALLDAGVVTNRNSVPRTRTAPGTPPASGSARPALTTRGFGARRVRPGRRAVVDVLAEHHAGHHQGRRAVQGDVRPGRRRRRPRPRPPRPSCSTSTRSTRASS